MTPFAVLKVRPAFERLMPPPLVLLALLQKTMLPLFVWKVRLSAAVLITPKDLNKIPEPAFVLRTFEDSEILPP